MNRSLTDGRPLSLSESPSNGSAPEQQKVSAERRCTRCGGALADGQDWCLHCGAGVSGAARSRPNWGSLASVAVIAVVLAGGATAAAYAALTQRTAHPSTRPALVAQTTVPAPTTSVPTTPATSVPSIPTSTPTPSTPTLPPVSPKPPKIPLSTPTPPPGTGETEPNPRGDGQTTGQTNTTTNGTGSTGSTGTTPGAEATPLLLDTDAASPYNPYRYPEAEFSDPSLAIDGDQTTGFTANVQAHSAPLMAEGLLIDLRSPLRVGELRLHSPSLGMTVEVYGAQGKKPPASITSHGWRQLARSKLIKRAETKIRLKEQSHAFRFFVLWMTRAPDTSTAAEPGHVTVQELSLFAAS